MFFFFLISNKIKNNLKFYILDYEKTKLEWDLAILELQHSVKHIQHIRPACLPLPKYSPQINRCKVPGWGQYSKSKEVSGFFFKPGAFLNNLKKLNSSFLYKRLKVNLLHFEIFIHKVLH